MKKLLAILSLTVLTFSGCSSSVWILISGDSEAVGAEIFIDDQKVGVMAKHVADGSGYKEFLVLDGDTIRRESTGLKPGHIFSSAEIEAPPGKHKFSFVNRDGKRLGKEIIIERGEHYWYVSFENMKIRHN